MNIFKKFFKKVGVSLGLVYDNKTDKNCKPCKEVLTHGRKLQ